MTGRHEGTGQPEEQQWWRLGFGAFLVLALVVGLYVSLFTGQPATTDDAAAPVDEETEPPEEEAEPEEADDGAVEEEAEEEAEDAPDEELIEAAPDPESTTVQVLDAGGGGSALEDATEVLEDLGYDVINTTSSGRDVDTTTVLYTSDNEPAALALRERDRRFSEVEPNERLSEAVDIHVLVGPDWE